MMRSLARLVLALTLAIGPAIGAVDAQDATKAPAKKAAASASTPKAGKDEKVCRYTFPTGEKRAWVCRKEQPCCAWDAVSYVKCGSTITGCL